MSGRQTSDPKPVHTTVAVRIPETDGGSLAAAASRRLAQAEGIQAVEDVSLQAVEPGLAATVVRVAVVVRAAPCLEREDVEKRVATAPGVQRVDELDVV